MRVIGIDPGTAIVGYGIIDYDKNKYIYKRRQFEDYSIFLPIPSREITITNNVIKQNFGYGN